ncbi:hypothetical protein Val02_15270 [Virgisporangium aliadipatigenens]|uniref:Uncharacterized protein n=1 Tax=Virgisporangium aliadipatigenens TaxID=741659 RepID=A0A8J3YGI6_9ACTN|nr:hypothetical protein [Virgisporangium aliadipatigenens]GIJ44641.1 hypothetical protein Val02_15270 [Virgisporangium aliadipatigenens]
MFGRIALHGIGAGVAWVVFTVQGLVVYLVLLAYAVGEDLGTGGPLAGPFLVLIAAVVGAVLVPLLFVPSMALGAADRGGPAGRFAVTAGAAALFAAIYVAGVSVATDVTAADAVVAWLVGLLALPGPLGAYAVVVYGGPAIWRRLLRPEPRAVIDVGTP